MGCSVIGEAFARRGDRHGLRVHRELTVHICYLEVIRITLRELVAHHLVRNRTFRHIGNAAFHNSRDSGSAYQTVRIISGLGLRLTVIGELFALRCNDHFFRFNRQSAIHIFGCEVLIVGNLPKLVVCEQDVIFANILACTLRVKAKAGIVDLLAVRIVGSISGLQGLIVAGVGLGTAVCYYRDRIVKLDLKVPVEAVLVFGIGIPFVFRNNPVVCTRGNLILYSTDVIHSV